MGLRAKTPRHPFPTSAPWLDAALSDVRVRVVRRAIAYCGIQETPLGSNRGFEIDRWLRWANVPELLIEGGKGWWCAAFAGGVLREEGLAVPADYASCDAWLPYCNPERNPVPGDIVLYGVNKNAVSDAHHIGIIVADAPQILTVEGNRAFAGTTNNGVAVDIGPMARRDILGYCKLEVFI